jgi:hypothetical protein
VKFSLGECVTKRPPRVQKLPLSSGIVVQVDTPTGVDSVVMSKIRTICLVSRHSLRTVSPVTTTKSRSFPGCS